MNTGLRCYILLRQIPYGYFLNIESNNLVLLKTYNTEFDNITITFYDQKGRPLEIKDKFNTTLLINIER